MLIYRLPDNTKRHGHAGGFSLTEISIVMGVVGVIVGGLWLGVGAMNSNMRVKKGQEAVLFMTQRMRAIHADRSQVDPTADMPGGETPAAIGGTNKKELTYIDAGVFPTDMVVGGNMVVNPWGGNVDIKATANSAGFRITMSRLRREDCITLLLNLGSDGRDSKLLGIRTSVDANDPNGAAGRDLALPVDLASASGANGCSSTANRNNVSFIFGL